MICIATPMKYIQVGILSPTLVTHKKKVILQDQATTTCYVGGCDQDIKLQISRR